MSRRKMGWSALAIVVLVGLTWFVDEGRHYFFLKRFAAVEEGELYRSGWPEPRPLARAIHDLGIRTVISLACEDEPGSCPVQAAVLAERHVRWFRMNWPGTGRGPYEEMDRAADLLADPSLRPVLFHCSGGMHRTNMALAAYRLRKCGWPLERVVDELRRYGFDPSFHKNQLKHLVGYQARVADQVRLAARLPD